MVRAQNAGWSEADLFFSGISPTRSSSLETPPSAAFDPDLTPAKQRVCELLLTALSNKEVARELGRTEATIKNQVASILRKHGVPSCGLLLALRPLRRCQRRRRQGRLSSTTLTGTACSAVKTRGRHETTKASAKNLRGRRIAANPLDSGGGRADAMSVADAAA